MHVVADVGTAHPENYIFRNVGGVIGDTLEGAGDHERSQGLRGEVRLGLHNVQEREVGGFIELVDGIIHGEHGFGEMGVGFDEGLERFAHHGCGEGGHLGCVDGEISDGECFELTHAVADGGGGIADTLEVSVDLDDGEDEAEVDGHGLLHGEKVEGHLVNFTLEAVDGQFAAVDEIADGEIASAVSFDGTLNGLFGHPGHYEEFFLQVIQTALEPNSRHPNLPVMCSSFFDACLTPIKEMRLIRTYR